jgi:hypothetical protein
MQEPQPVTPIQSAVTGLRHNAESAAVGSLLGFIDAEFGGLDIRGRYPVDGIAAALFFGLSIRDAGKPEGLGGDYRAVSQACTTTFFYRSVKAWREGRKGIPENTHSKASDDPIVLAGRAAGF